MSTTVELLDGFTATLRDTRTLTNRQRRPVLEIAARDEKDIDADELARALIIALVESWSLALPVPSEDPESVDDMPALVYDKLKWEVSSRLSDLVWAPTDPKALQVTRRRSRPVAGRKE